MYVSSVNKRVMNPKTFSSNQQLPL